MSRINNCRGGGGGGLLHNRSRRRVALGSVFFVAAVWAVATTTRRKRIIAFLSRYHNNNYNYVIPHGLRHNLLPFVSSKKHHKHDESDATVHFPTLVDTQEMAKLSLLVYLFRHETNQSAVCHQIQTGNFSLPAADNDASRSIPGRTAALVPVDLQCHWYHHAPSTGTQVMIVSSVQQDYLAIVYAGTDDLQTSLVDTDVRWEAFGDGDNWTLPNSDENTNMVVKVHAGFNKAVFTQNIMNDIQERVTDLRRQNDTLAALRIRVTGHSLGAAAAVLTAMALTEYYYPQQQQESNDNQQPFLLSLLPKHWWNPFHRHKRHHHHHNGDDDNAPNEIVTINFGCPRIGNTAYRQYFPHTRLHVWRVVLGWDLVPRLPDFFQHGGHTVQIATEKDSSHENVVDSSSNNNNNNNNNRMVMANSENQKHPALGVATTTDLSLPWSTNPNQTRVARAYYQHYGNVTLGYAGVPLGWASRSYIWVPGALGSHHISRYCRVLQEWSGPWLHEFVPLDDDDDDDDNHTTVDDDDDAYVNPPFDDFPQDGAVNNV